MSKTLEMMLEELTGAYCREDIKRSKEGKPPKTHIGKLYSLLTNGLDSAEEVLATMRIWDSVENAEGKVLDRYGNNFGVLREGADDEFYRLLILVKMMAQLSGGDVDTVIGAAAALFQVATDHIEFAEVFPAKVRIYIEEDDITEKQWAVIELIAKMIKRVVAAGVGFKLFTKAARIINTFIPIHTGLIVMPHTTITPTNSDIKKEQKIYIGAYQIETAHLTITPQEVNQNSIISFYVGSGVVEEVRYMIGGSI